jgi:hypothetical protein
VGLGPPLQPPKVFLLHIRLLLSLLPPCIIFISVGLISL